MKVEAPTSDDTHNLLCASLLPCFHSTLRSQHQVIAGPFANVKLRPEVKVRKYAFKVRKYVKVRKYAVKVRKYAGNTASRIFVASTTAKR